MMTFENRLRSYTGQFTLRKNRGEDGLTGSQRSRTFPGLARAMATQWSTFAEQYYTNQEKS